MLGIFFPSESKKLGDKWRIDIWLIACFQQKHSKIRVMKTIAQEQKIAVFEKIVLLYIFMFASATVQMNLATELISLSLENNWAPENLLSADYCLLACCFKKLSTTRTPVLEATIAVQLHIDDIMKD